MTFQAAQRRWTYAFSNDEGGVALLFGGTLLLVCCFIGAAIDMARYRSAGDAMQQVADAAALAATAEFSKSGDLLAATRRAQIYIDSSADRLPGVSSLKATAAVDASENVRIRVLGSMDTTFLALIGLGSFRLSSIAEASVSNPHMDLHMLIDSTGSMNIPDTPADIARMATLFRPYGGTDNCNFACHGTGASEVYNGKSGFQIARENGIYLREDRIRDSLVQMVDLLSTSSAARGLRISPYTFQWSETQLLAPSNDFDAVRTAISAITNQSGGTNITNVLRLMNDRFIDGGTGKQENPKKAILLVTDGVNQGNDSLPQHIDTAQCDALKAKGIILYVLNVHYPDPNSLQGPAATLAKVDEFRPVIEEAPTHLTACATSGKYWDAYGGDAITQAILEIGADIGAPRPLRLTQ